MSVINTNISALAAQSSLRKTGLNSAMSMERLSTGVRINSAKDDAAGLAISTRMTANIRGMAAAIRNSNDGISLTQTAEGSLSAIQDNLQRIRELAVQSANSGNSASDRGSLNLEAQQLISEIDRVATNSAFNGSKLLDGTYKDQDFQVGSGNDISDRIRISIGSAKSANLGTQGAAAVTASVSLSGAVTTTAIAAGDLSINGFAIAPSVSDGLSTASSNASAIAKANAINASSSLTGVTAKALATTIEFAMSSGASTASGATASGSVLINGVDIGSLTQSDTTSNTTASNGRALQLIAAINAKTAQTGVTAAAGQTTNALTLTASDGRNIVVGGTLGAGLSGISAGTTLAKLQLTTANGATSVTINGPGTASIGIGWLAGLAANTGVGQTVSSIDLSSQTGSQSALSVLDTAIDTITNSRANLGAYQNRFEAAISNLQTTSTNLQASRSRILDTDYAKETTNLAKAQIVQQAATAMLAQANQSSQSVLALLK